MPTIAVLGASSNRNKFGNKCVRAYARAGYQVFPINPTEKEIEGFPAFAKLADVPAALDRISIYLPPPVTLDYLEEIEAAEAGEVWLNPGAYDTKVLEKARGLGIPIRPGCSIVDIGLSPAMFGA
jgi:predicted CoA-binding protein